jgi:hypothetical protein
MKIVIGVTVVFFVLTLLGTWLARRSAYTWADNEKSMGPSGSPASDATGAPPPRTTGSTNPGRAASPRASTPQRIVATGFDDPKGD